MGNGSLLILPGNMADEQEKDESVMTARLVCIAYRATAVVFVSEAWMTVSKENTAIRPPSQSPNRKEIVMLLGETGDNRKQKILPIVRAESGDFSGFGDPRDSSFDSVEGRFTEILPPLVTLRAQTMAKKLLAVLGVSLEVVNG
jgi:hypothetical protein